MNHMELNVPQLRGGKRIDFDGLKNKDRLSKNIGEDA